MSVDHVRSSRVRSRATSQLSSHAPPRRDRKFGRSTLHTLSLLVRKLCRIGSTSPKLYRVPSGTMARSLYSADAFHVCGGVTRCFTSCTRSLALAKRYAAVTPSQIVYEIHQGLGDRAADLSWLSQVRNRHVTAM